MNVKFNMNLFWTPRHCQTWNRGEVDSGYLKHWTEKHSKAEQGSLEKKDGVAVCAIGTGI